VYEITNFGIGAFRDEDPLTATVLSTFCQFGNCFFFVLNMSCI